MRSRGIVAALVALVSGILVTNASASPIAKGTVEMTPSLSFAHNSLSFSGTDAGSLSTLQVSALVGYFVTNMVELVGGVVVDRTSISDPGFLDESSTQIGFLAGVQLNFATAGRTVPFVRGALGVLDNSGSLSAGSEATMIAPELAAGLRVLVGSSASVNFALDYQHRTSEFGVQDLSSSTFGMNVGLSIFLGQ